MGFDFLKNGTRDNKVDSTHLPNMVLSNRRASKADCVVCT